MRRRSESRLTANIFSSLILPLPAFHPLEIRGSVDRPSNPRDTQTRARSTPNGPLRSVHLSRTRHGRGPLRARFHPRRRARVGERSGTIFRPTGPLGPRKVGSEARESATTMALFDSTRTLGVPGGSFHGDASMSASMYGRGGSTCGVDRNALDEISSDISSANIATCTGRIAQYQVRSRLRSRINSPETPSTPSAYVSGISRSITGASRLPASCPFLALTAER